MLIIVNEAQWPLGPQNVRNFSYPVRIRWIKSSNFASFIYIAGYLNVRKMSEMLVFRTFVGALSISVETFKTRGTLPHTQWSDKFTDKNQVHVIFKH